MKRRSFLKGTLATGAAAIAVNAGLLVPSTVLAAEWNKAAFDAVKVEDAIKALYGSANMTDSGDVKLKAPAIAENGAVTPITVDATGISGVESIAILADKNPTALASVHNFSGPALGFIATRIKMGKTMNVIAVVKAGGKLLKTQQQVKVTIGGCGG